LGGFLGGNAICPTLMLFILTLIGTLSYHCLAPI
jgi:hypothetical protein